MPKVYKTVVIWARQLRVNTLHFIVVWLKVTCRAKKPNPIFWKKIIENERGRGGVAFRLFVYYFRSGQVIMSTWLPCKGQDTSMIVPPRKGQEKNYPCLFNLFKIRKDGGFHCSIGILWESIAINHFQIKTSILMFFYILGMHF